jgi:microsomal dipeptidase-like Zn-dependent dipeptidase
MERIGIVVDLAHMSSAAIRDTAPLLRRPFFLSHTGFVERCSSRGWRRYSAATRNVSMADARLVAEAGGVVGVVFATQLLGGDSPDDLVDTLRFAVDAFGRKHVALGSDLDGALRSVIDAARYPLLTQGLLDAGMSRKDVAAVMGGNAVRVLRAVLE